MSVDIFTIRDTGKPAVLDPTGNYIGRSGSKPKAIGLLFNKHAWWLGVHYSKHNGRVCINLLPCLTLWATQRGGTEP